MKATVFILSAALTFTAASCSNPGNTGEETTGDSATVVTEYGVTPLDTNAPGEDSLRQGTVSSDIDDPAGGRRN